MTKHTDLQFRLSQLLHWNCRHICHKPVAIQRLLRKPLQSIVLIVEHDWCSTHSPQNPASIRLYVLRCLAVSWSSRLLYGAYSATLMAYCMHT